LPFTAELAASAATTKPKNALTRRSRRISTSALFGKNDEKMDNE
jgi:hypothetical protein